MALRIEGDPIAANNGLFFLHSDHLGSTSLTLDASGNKIGEMKYYPFGETRSGSAPTDRRFTGQRQEDSSLGSLYDFNARMYSPALGRFLSADTIVPDRKSPQHFNRYAYTTNNPLRYVDPNGHCEGDPNDPNNADIGCWNMITQIQTGYTNIHVDPLLWKLEELQEVWEALTTHMFIDSLLTASRIDLYRRHWLDYQGDGTAGLTTTYMPRNAPNRYEITIYDKAYNVTPDANNFNAPVSLTNFRSSVFHEFTHVALKENQSIVDSYRENAPSLEYWRPFGGGYSCITRGGCDEEIIARASTAYELGPISSMGYYDIFGGYHSDWRQDWLGDYATIVNLDLGDTSGWTISAP